MQPGNSFTESCQSYAFLTGSKVLGSPQATAAQASPAFRDIGIYLAALSAHLVMLSASMAARALWKGHLRLSLVSIPVELYSAKKSGARISFRQIHEPSGKPVRYEKVVPGIGPVDADDIVKGYEYDDQYLLIEPEEIEAIKLETRKTLELVQFVDACEIPPLYFDKPYYLTAADELAEDAYRVVRDALRASSKIGLGQITMRGREYLVAIKPCGDGLLLETLLYEDEIRNAEELFVAISDEDSDEELLDMATALIEKKTAPFDASAYQDNYSESIKALIDRKLHNRKIPRVDSEAERYLPGDNVIDLMSALRKSLKTDQDGSTKSKAATARKAKPKATTKTKAKAKTKTKAKAAPGGKAASPKAKRKKAS